MVGEKHLHLERVVQVKSKYSGVEIAVLNRLNRLLRGLSIPAYSKMFKYIALIGLVHQAYALVRPEGVVCTLICPFQSSTDRLGSPPSTRLELLERIRVRYRRNQDSSGSYSNREARPKGRGL